jgi:membrane protein
MEECQKLGTLIEQAAIVKQSVASSWDFGGLNALSLLRRTWKEMNEDRIFDSAAALAYYLLLSSFPLLIFIVSLMVAVASQNMLNSLLGQLAHVMPADAYRLIYIAASRLTNEPTGGLLTVGLLGTLWSASSGIASIMDGLNRAYEVEETRSFVTRRALSIALTVGLTLLTILGAGMLVASDKIGAWLSHAFDSTWTNWAGMLLSIVSGMAAMVAGFGLIHYFGPNLKARRKSFFTPGSIIGILLFLLASFGLSEYIRISGGFSSKVYGAFGGMIVLLLWLYLLGLAILIGGELNSEIAKASSR